MTMPIRFQTYLAWLVTGLILGSSAAQFFVSIGQPFPQSPGSLLLTLPLCALGGYLATLPIVRYRKKLEKFTSGATKQRPERVNPFYAFRVLVLARAIAIAGTGFLGWHLGQLLWLLAFSVAASALVLPTVFGALGALAMLIGGLLGEQNCKSPKDPEDGAQ